MVKNLDSNARRIGIIGGTVVLDESMLREVSRLKVHTPYGSPSAMPISGKIKSRSIVVIPRHGDSHTINPTNVNYRANIWAMKSLNAERVFSVNAVGSLKEDVKPGEIVFPDQFIDMTKSRKSTFYDGHQVCHISSAEPFCPELRKILIETANELSIPFHPKGTCVVIEGPRFSSRAESHIFRGWGADIINMTMFPEVILAKEAELCYANISMVTDYDCWKEHTVSNEEVMKTMKSNVNKVRKLLMAVIPRVEDERKCECRNSLRDALM
jgi:5'-methylthioadenosine phosphorylase